MLCYYFLLDKLRGCGGIGIRARLRGVWLCLASSSLAIRIFLVEQIGGVFVEVPTRQVKPSQTCPKCGHQHKKTLDIRVHECGVCGYVQDRDIASAEAMLYWAKGNLSGFGTSLVDGDVTSSTSPTSKKAGSMKQLEQAKRQKSKSTGLGSSLNSQQYGRKALRPYTRQQLLVIDSWYFVICLLAMDF